MEGGGCAQEGEIGGEAFIGGEASRKLVGGYSLGGYMRSDRRRGIYRRGSHKEAHKWLCIRRLQEEHTQLGDEAARGRLEVAKVILARGRQGYRREVMNIQKGMTCRSMLPDNMQFIHELL